MGKEIFEILPDFDDMDTIGKEITDAKARLEDAKNALDIKVAECIQKAMTNEEYWVNGKPPTMGYCNSVVAIKGNTKQDEQELKTIKQEIVKQTERYNGARQKQNVMAARIDIWRTESANNRKALG